MAYLAPYYAYDAFVSYSHGDPLGSGDSPLKRWTVSLIRDLKAEIRSVDTEFDNLEIWFDENIDPTAHLTTDLRNKVKSSGLLVVVMSPRYLASSWCKDELDWFRDQVMARSNDQGRVFVIRVLPTNEAEWPDFLRDERGNSPLGFRFHDPVTRMPYGWRDAGNNSEEFVKQLWMLQTALTRRLREVRAREESRAATPTSQVALPGPGRRIYLHARVEDANLCNTVRSQLAEDGMTPLSRPIDAGTTLGDWARESKARMEAAKLCTAMALVRTNDNERFVGDLLDIGIDERQRIQAARGRPLPCAVLDGSGESLPIDVSPYGIRRFDVSNPNWRNEFRAWVDASQSQAVAAE
jgi:TIR domain